MPLSNRSRRLSAAPVAHLERRGRGSLGGGSASGGISHSFPECSHFIQGVHPFYGVLSQHHLGQSLGAGGGVSAPEGSHRAGSASFAGLLQPFVRSHEGLGVVAASNRSFAVEPQSAQNTFQDGDSPIGSVVSPQGRLDGLHRLKGCISPSSNASKDAYLQVPMHPESRKFLRFMAFGKVYQFKVLCFGLSTAPQVFMRVMAPVSAILHSLGIRLQRYLDD